jgi:hypothetical protein
MRPREERLIKYLGTTCQGRSDYANADALGKNQLLGNAL